MTIGGQEVRTPAAMFDEDGLPIVDGERGNLLKFVLLGDERVGKTALLNRLVRGSFVDHYTPTIGVDFAAKEIDAGGKLTHAHFWDAGANERFRFILQTFLHHVQGAIVVFSVTDKASFENVPQWLGLLRQHNRGELRATLLVGTKCDADSADDDDGDDDDDSEDTENEEDSRTQPRRRRRGSYDKVDGEVGGRQVRYAAAKALADEHNLSYVEASAKTGRGVHDAFANIVADINNRPDV